MLIRKCCQNSKLDALIKEDPIVVILAESIIFVSYEFNEKLLKKLKVRIIRVLFKILMHFCMWSLFKYYKLDLIPCNEV